MMSPHEIVNPETLMPPIGFGHAVIAAPGRTIYLGGQTAHGPDGQLVASTIVGQFHAACGNVVAALRAAGASPEHVVSMQIFLTDAQEYVRSLKEVGEAYRGYFGHHYPAMGIFEVTGLFDPRALVELMCIAVIPES